ncbi:MAG: MiaB/RimO family radical SAM methylthiotransferase [Bellilinea sp.]
MKIFLDSIGCRLNQSEIERFATQFRAAGHTIVNSAGEAELVVVNTCTVTQAAASDSRQKIRQAARLGAADIVVTGCWSTLEPDNAAVLPNVRRVVSNLNKDHLVAEVLGVQEEDFDLEPVAREPLPGAHLRTRAFIKTQDGCDNHCTFCITRIARGPGRSETIQAVLSDIQHAQSGGTREVVLSGVHLGSWGYDLSPRMHLRDLIQAVLRDTDVERLRLSSLEPWDLEENFFQLWENSRLCRHLHLPLQSGCEQTLHRMARHTNPAAFRRLVESARQAAPGMAVTTDLIVGFPGEDDREFAESLTFVQEMEFAGGHVFSYSARPGTPAVRLNNPVSGTVAHRRSEQMRQVLAESSALFREQHLGSEACVLWEATNAYGPTGWKLHGLTDNYLRVEVHSPQRLWNQINRVRLDRLTDQGLAGSLIE